MDLLRYFTNKKKKEDRSDDSAKSVSEVEPNVSNKSSNDGNEERTESEHNVRTLSDGTATEKEDVSNSTSISEHIVKNESTEVSQSNYEISQRDLSIPSLHLKSLSKSDSDYDGINPSVGNNSNIFESQNSNSHTKNTPDKTSSELIDSLENKSAVDGSSSNSNRDLQHNEADNISNESSIHTKLDTSTTSSKAENLLSDKELDLSNHVIQDPEDLKNVDHVDSANSSASEEIIKVDIRGTASRGFPFESKMFIIGNMDAIPARDGNDDFIALNDNIVNLSTLDSLPVPHFFKNSTASNLISEKCDIHDNSFFPVNKTQVQYISRVKIEPTSNKSDDFEQDYATEEMILNESRDIFPSTDNEDNIFVCNITNKPSAEGESSLSTVTTEYKTLCDEFQMKMNHVNDVLAQRDLTIEELQTSLSYSNNQREKAQLENQYLSVEVGKLQQLLSDATSDGVYAKDQLSDFIKNENMVNECYPEAFNVETGPCQIFNNINNQNINKISTYTQTEIDECVAEADDHKKTNLNEMNYLKSNIFLTGIEEFQEELDVDETPLYNKFREKIVRLLDAELNSKYEMFISDLNNLNEKLANQENNHATETKRLRGLLQSLKCGNPDIINLRNEMEIKHQKEMEELRTYFEQKCVDMEKHYSEDVFSQQSKKISPNSSADSLNNCPEAMPFGSPLHTGGTNYSRNSKMQRSHSVEFQLGTHNEKLHFENLLNDLKAEHQTQIKVLTKNYDSQINELIDSHKAFILELEDDHKGQISELKAHLQTYQNTEMDVGLSHYVHGDTDLELEKKDLCLVVVSKQEQSGNKNNLQEDYPSDDVLLADSNIDPSGWSLNLISLKDKIEAEAQQTIEQLKMTHAEELASLREENTKQVEVDTQKHVTKEDEWRLKRYEAFDKNRHLEEVVKERDGLKHITLTLQRVISQLVDYFNLCEDELNNTFVGELLRQVLIADENFDNTIVLSCGVRTPTTSSNPSPDHSLDHIDHNISALSTITNAAKKMHFVPDVNGIITYIDPDCTFNDFDRTEDVSVNFKNHLDTCLQRLRIEAQELVALSANRIPKRLSILPADAVNLCDETAEKDEISKIVEAKKGLHDHELLREMLEKSEAERKDLEDSLAQSLYQEVVLKEELHAAMEKISELITDHSLNQTREIISEGYGVVTHPRTPVSLPPHPRVSITSPPPLLASEGNTPEGGRSLSLDGLIDKKSAANHETVRRLSNELEVTTKEKEDIQMQLEAANKQLRSTRQFLEEQAVEREQERDEFQRELEQLKDENNKLTSKTQHHGRICKEVEQLESQIREVSGFNSTLEDKNMNLESELKANTEKIAFLRDIIGNLENQIESKSVNETDLLKELNGYKEIVDEKDLKMKDLASELEKLRDELSEKIAGEALAAGEKHAINIASELETEKKLVEQMRGQLHTLVDIIAEHTSALENLHEAVCSQSCSSPSEDVSIRDHKKRKDAHDGDESHFAMPTSPTKLILQLPLLEMSRLGDSVHRHLKAEDAALKRIRDLEMQLIQLKDVAQELRTERDILQERMSEQSLKISSLQSRLDQTRHTAEAMTHQTTEDLRLQLDEALSETQLLKEALDSRDKQVARLKALVENTKKRLGDQEQELSACTGSSKDLIQRLKNELRMQQSKNRDLQEALEESNYHNKSMPEILESVVADKDANIDLLKQQLLEKEQQVQAMLSLQLEDEEILKQMSNSDKDFDNHGKLSARTLSDILSISEFDEPDLMMRRAVIHPQTCLSGEFNMSLNATKNQNVTSAPDAKAMPMSPYNQVDNRLMESLQELSIDKNASLPKLIKQMVDKSNEASPLNSYNRNVNETIMFGVSLKSDKHSSGNADTKSNPLSDNHSIYPNKDATDDKNISIEPKRINFSAVNTTDEFKHLDECNKSPTISFKSLGIVLEQGSYPDILVQLKHHISKVQAELDSKQLALATAEEQLAELPHIKSKMEELKNLLQSNIQTMQDDKKYFNNQLENFATGEGILKQQLEKAISDVNEKSNELQILKEDILKRENIVIGLAKEKRNLLGSLQDMEKKCKILENSQSQLIGAKSEGGSDVQGFEQLISEKNQQIDNLNVNLDKLDDIQRELNEYKDHVNKLTFELQQKCVELDGVSKINKDLNLKEKYLEQEKAHLTNRVQNLSENNFVLQCENDQMKQNLEKLQSDLMDASRREVALIEKENQHRIEGYEENENIKKFNDFQLLLNDLDKIKSIASDAHKNQQNSGKWDLNRIRDYINSLQAELDEQGKELNIKVFKLERAKLEIIDLKNKSEEYVRYISEIDQRLQIITAEKMEIKSNLESIENNLREESNIEDLRMKFNRKIEECTNLESEVVSLRNIIERYNRDTNSDRERDDRLQELSVENGRLKQQLYILDNKISNQNNIITELNDVKDNLVADIQALEDKSEEEKDTSVRLQMLLDTEKQMSNNIQSQDTNVIQILKGRLEVSLDSETELKMLLEREKKNSSQLHKQVESYKKQLDCVQGKSTQEVNSPNSTIIVLQEKLVNATSQLDHQIEIVELLKSELTLLKTKYDREKSKLAELQNVRDREKLCIQREIDGTKDQISTLKTELAELMRQKHETHLELVHTREQLHLQKNENLIQEKRLRSGERNVNSESYKTLVNELEQRNIDLNLELTSLKHKLDAAGEREKNLHLLYTQERQSSGIVGADGDSTTLYHIKEMQMLLRRHISENVQISETVKELTRERKELQMKIKKLENQIEIGGFKRTASLLHLPEDIDQQVRFLYGRYMRMHSYRKQLVWQKQYLVRVVSAFEEWEMKIINPQWPIKSKGRKRFKCIALAVSVVCRMKYLVRRWHTSNELASNMHLNIPNSFPTGLRSSKSYTHIPSPAMSREKLIRSRYSNPTASHHSPPTKAESKSRLLSSDMNLNMSDGYADRHISNQMMNQPMRSNMLFRDISSYPDRWHSAADPHLLRGSHQELSEYPEDGHPLRSISSDHGTSSAFSRYVSRSELTPMMRHRTSNFVRDPL